MKDFRKAWRITKIKRIVGVTLTLIYVSFCIFMILVFAATRHEVSPFRFLEFVMCLIS